MMRRLGRVLWEAGAAHAKAQRMPLTALPESGLCSRAWWAPGPPPTLRWEVLGGARSEAPLACLQVRSKGTSTEEWKDSETYSPNTAYGKTPAPVPDSGDPPDPGRSILARQPIRSLKRQIRYLLEVPPHCLPQWLHDLQPHPQGKGVPLSLRPHRPCCVSTC